MRPVHRGGYDLPLTTPPDVRKTRYLAHRNQGLSLLSFDRREHLLNRLLDVPTAIRRPGIDDCAANIVSRIVLTIVEPRTNAASDNRNLGNISNVAGLTVLVSLCPFLEGLIVGF